MPGSNSDPPDRLQRTRRLRHRYARRMTAERASAEVAQDVLLGVLYGDCLGAPYEFTDGTIVGDVSVGRSVFGHPAGRGTDDTETTIAVAQGILDAARGDRGVTTAVAERMLAWYDGRPPDVGGTTAQGLINFRRSGDPRTGSSAPTSVANGSLMRSAPYALLNGDGSELAVDSSRTTHAHQTVLGCVRAYVRMLQLIISGDPLDQTMINDLAEVDLELHPRADPRAIPCAGIGYAPYALDLAVWSALQAEDFHGGLTTIVRLGGDTDTNGAICGAVLAARFGFPETLLADLDQDRVSEVTRLANALTAVEITQLR